MWLLDRGSLLESFENLVKFYAREKNPALFHTATFAKISLLSKLQNMGVDSGLKSRCIPLLLSVEKMIL